MYLGVDIIKGDIGHLVTKTAHVQNQITSCHDTLLDQQVRQKEMTEIVGCELALNAVLGQNKLSGGHDSSIIDEDVDMLCDGLDLLDGLANRLIAEKVELDKSDFDGGIGLLDLIDNGSDLGFVTTSEDDELWRGRGERNRVSAPIPPWLGPVIKTENNVSRLWLLQQTDTWRSYIFFLQPRP